MNSVLSENLPTFLLGFSSLFPLINPVGTALIIQPYFSELDDKSRKRHALRIVLICFIMGFVTLHAGSHILKFMGVSIPATQTAGGIVIAVLGFNLLNSQAASGDVDDAKHVIDDSIFYPLSFPLTLGPGGLATLIALSAHVHSDGDIFLSPKLTAITLSLLVILAVAYFCFANTGMLIKRMGSNGSQVMNRLMSFLVFSIGIQMAFTGIMGLIKSSA
jgi:multiple antibiotic resistance protein